MKVTKTPSTRRWGLTARLATAAVVTVVLTLGLFTAMTAWRLEHGAEVQAAAVTAIAEERFSEQLRLQNRLVDIEFDRLAEESGRIVKAIAQSGETARVVSRGNIVAIDLLLKKSVKRNSLNGIIIFDSSLKALGSHQPGLALLDANRVFGKSPLAKIARSLILGSEADEWEVDNRWHEAEKEYLEALGMPDANSGLTIVSLAPVFDDFGDVIAILVGHRLVQPNEIALTQLATKEALGIRVLDGGKVLFSTGLKGQVPAASQGPVSWEMGTSRDGELMHHCTPFKDSWQLCVDEPVSHFHDLADPLVSSINEQKTVLLGWLILLALGSVVFAALAASLATRRVMAPLQRITAVVRSVAKGNWLAHVPGQRRWDEVGDIARAITVLQQSMKERERLKADVADIAQVRMRHEAMEVAAKACRNSVRKTVFSVSDLAEQIESEAIRLNGLAGLAEGEADEARLVAQRVGQAGGSDQQIDPAEKGHAVVDAIDRLGETLGVISGNVGQVLERVSAIVNLVGQVDKPIKEFTRAIDDQDDYSLGSSVKSGSQTFRQEA